MSPRFFLSELRLMMGRRRNQAGLLVLAAVPVLIAISVKSTLSQPGQDAPDFFRSITENGLFVALAALTIELGLFLPLAVSVVSGDSRRRRGQHRHLALPAGHAGDRGPPAAGQVRRASWSAAFVATYVVTVVGMAMGLVLFGGGSMTMLSGTQISFVAGLVRVLLAASYLACGLAALGAVGLFVSTLTEQPIAAMIDDDHVQLDVVRARLDPPGRPGCTPTC